MGSVTIKDVAKRADVSIKTVSRVLNNEPLVKASTRDRVMQAIKELGYRPNQIARGLLTSRTETIGIVVSNITNNFIGEVIRGIESVTSEANYSLIVCNTDQKAEEENRYLDVLLRHQVDGIITAATSQQWASLTEAEKHRTPIVFLDRKFEGMDGPFVGVDNVEGAFVGVNHLINCGHKRIGMIAGLPYLSSMRERRTGFERALATHGLPIRTEWIVESSLTIDEGRIAARKILSMPEPPHALFVSTNLLALGTLLALKDLGLRCPEDLALVAFDDHPWAEVSNPPLTVVRQPARAIGQEAAQLLLSLLIDGDEVRRTQILLPPELIVRESCAASSA